MSRRNSYKTGDRFNQKAKDEGYRARSVYKLSEIQKRFRPFKQGQRVIDLGCAPGSWSRYAQQQVGRNGVVVGIDIQEVQSLAGCTLLQRDVYTVTSEELLDLLGGPADIVLSDMAPNTTGDRFGDHVRQIAIARRALEVATQTLAPGGAFVCKVFEGEDAPGFVDDVRKLFTTTKRVRPEAVRRESVELFVLGMGYRPA
ncbi:MAG: RlmE family RNA methyltransferase [Alphaproteobacteria bacterium]|nr:RlmE family RNA methyltransferase [Alphaproteobacteria bacterium]MCB9694460.1 RlmE family RNA methyltransferase [Alphaproteobacteria bacterium]